MANAPAGVNDFVYPGMIEVRENDAEDEALRAARQANIADPIPRDILPHLDLNAGEDITDVTTFTGDEEYFVQFETDDSNSLSAGDYTVYEIDSDTGKADDRVLAIYGFEVVSGGEYVNVVRFRGSDGQVFERAHIQGFDSSGDTPVDRQATLKSPVLFDAQDNGEIEFSVEKVPASSESVRIKLLGVTVEKQGRRVGTRN